MHKKNNILAFIVIGALGTLFHFIYEWSGNNPIVGVFGTVNESIWEHQKLLYFPITIYSVFEYLRGAKQQEGYISSVVFGGLSAIASVIILFYTYSGVLGFMVDWVNIALFFIGVVVFLIVRNILLKNRILSSSSADLFALVLWIILGILFVVWTFYPPKLGIFIPPVQ